MYIVEYTLYSNRPLVRQIEIKIIMSGRNEEMNEQIRGTKIQRTNETGREKRREVTCFFFLLFQTQHLIRFVNTTTTIIIIHFIYLRLRFRDTDKVRCVYPTCHIYRVCVVDIQTLINPSYEVDSAAR